MEKLDILWRGQCGAWVMEMPDTEIIDQKDVEAMMTYANFYGGFDDYDYTIEESETCVHGMELNGQCKLCAEEFMAGQFAFLRMEDGVLKADIIQALDGMHGLAALIDATKIVNDVFANPQEYGRWVAYND